jgi:hypothetical protein
LSSLLALGVVSLTISACGATTTPTVTATTTTTIAPTAVQVREKAAAEIAVKREAAAKEASAKREEAALAGTEAREAAATRHAEEFTAREEKAKEAAERHRTVPNVVNVRLDVAEEEVEGAHLQYKVVGGGLFGVVVKSDWTVCETKPDAGSPIDSGATVRLIVARSCE